MQPFGKQFYHALAIGFLIGSLGMALSANGLSSHAHAAASHATTNHAASLVR